MIELDTKWIVRSSRSLYADKWLDLQLADVELPDGRHLDHRVIQMAPSVGVVILDHKAVNVLLLWRHRFITDTWGWEIPCGGIDDGESAIEAAEREAEEETGWRPAALRPLLEVHPSAGILNSKHFLFLSQGAIHVGEPTDSFESDRVAWVALKDVPDLVRDGHIQSGSTISALLYLLAVHSELEDRG